MICNTVLHGFSCRRESGDYGVGVHLFSKKHCFDCARLSNPDENGVRHVLLCRVILGKRELVTFGSKQCSPSSMEFDSGVDSLVNPKRFIIWSSDMNSHILPLFVISFNANLRDIPRSIQPSAAAAEERQSTRRSARVNLTKMMNTLAKVLPAPRMVLLNKSVDDYRANKISRAQLIRRMITLAGEELLASVVRSCNRSDTTNGSEVFDANCRSLYNSRLFTPSIDMV